MHSFPISTLLSELQALSLMTAQPCLLAPRPASTTSWEHTTCDTADQLAVMRKLEVSRYFPQDYLPENETTAIRFRQRRMTVEFLYRVVDYGGFRRDVVAYAVGHLMDRYLATQDTTTVLPDPNQYQLVALTCLYMAVKILEPQNIGVDSLVPLTNGVFSPHDFVQMERTILHSLDWCVGHGPTPLAFVKLLMPFLPPYADAITLYNHVQYQLEVAVSDYSLTRALPSDLAVVALWNALDSMELSASEIRTSRRAVLSALQYSSQEKEWLKIRVDCLQDQLCRLMLATYSWTTASQSCGFHAPCSTTPLEKNNPRYGGNSPVTVVRKESPAHNGDLDSEVELILFE